MRFFLDDQEILNHDILPDDLVSTVAKKINATNRYFYGKCATKTTGADLAAKYGRPLARKEMAYELRNMGTPPLELGRVQYTEDDILDIVSCVKLVPLGQTLPEGLAVEPRWRYTGGVGRLSHGARLLDFYNLVEVRAVTVPEVLTSFYKYIVPIPYVQDEALRISLKASPPSWRVIRAATRVPSRTWVGERDLLQIYRRVHATEKVPVLSFFGAPTRRHHTADDLPVPEKEGIVCRFNTGTVVVFHADGTVSLTYSDDRGLRPDALDAAVRNLVNPLVNMVNNTLRYKGPLEMDAAADAHSDSFSDHPFPLFQSFADGECAIDVRVEFEGHLFFPRYVPSEWGAAFSPGPTYLRGHHPRRLELKHSDDKKTFVTLLDLQGPSYADIAAQYLQGFLGSKSADSEVLDEISCSDTNSTIYQKITLSSPLERVEKEGFSVLERSEHFAKLRNSDGVECLVPLPSMSPPTDDRQVLPTLDAYETESYLDAVAATLPCRPIGWVYDAKGAVVAVETEYGARVQCKKTRPSPPDWYTLYVSLVRRDFGEHPYDAIFAKRVEEAELEKVAFSTTNAPKRIAGRSVFPEQLRNALRRRLLHECRSNVHVRCTFLGMTVRFGNVVFDKLPDETVQF